MTRWLDAVWVDRFPVGGAAPHSADGSDYQIHWAKNSQRTIPTGLLATDHLAFRISFSRTPFGVHLRPLILSSKAPYFRKPTQGTKIAPASTAIYEDCYIICLSPISHVSHSPSVNVDIDVIGPYSARICTTSLL